MGVVVASRYDCGCPTTEHNFYAREVILCRQKIESNLSKEHQQHKKSRPVIVVAQRLNGFAFTKKKEAKNASTFSISVCLLERGQVPRSPDQRHSTVPGLSRDHKI